MAKVKKISRRNFLRLALYGGAGIAGGIGYAKVDNLEVIQGEIRTKEKHLDGLTIAVLADFHAGAFLRRDYMQRIVEKANGFHPHIICLLGDYVDGVISRSTKNLANADFIFPLLAGLKAEHGVFAVLGNHDHWSGAESVSAQLTRHGIQVLNNGTKRIREGLVVAGVDDYWEGPARLERVLEGVSNKDYVVLMSHNPDINLAMTPNDPVNLVLSGHTHGGQIRLPFVDRAFWVPCSHRYKNSVGLIRETSTRYTFLSKGVGTFFVPVRLNCPPDIGIVRFKAF